HPLPRTCRTGSAFFVATRLSKSVNRVPTCVRAGTGTRRLARASNGPRWYRYLRDWHHRAGCARRLRREQRRARRHGARRRAGDVVAAVPRSRKEPADVARRAVPVDVSAERVAEDLVVAGIEDLARAGVVRGGIGVHGPAEV